MSMVKGNPEEIRNFAGSLARYAEQLRTETSRIDGEFAQIESWDDEKRAEFSEILSELRSVITRFSENADEQVAYLRQLAQRLDDYLHS